MRVLVTGGAGFIGSNLTLRLLSEGHHVCVVDDLSLGRLSNLEPLSDKSRLKFVHGSILDASLMEPLVREADVVFHLAAVVGVKHILANPLKGIRTNVLGTEVVLELAHRYKRRTLIASSSEVYGKSVEVPLREDSDRLLGPTYVERWSYADSKALDEYMAFSYARLGLPVSVVRYFNSYGPRTHPNGYGSVVTRFIMQALRHEPLTVYGDGQQTRSFTFVEDTVEGTIRAAVTDAAVGEVFNIGDNREVSIRELAERIRATVGSPSEIVYVPFNEAFGNGYEETMRRVPDTTKAKTVLGFEARVPLGEGLKRTIEWFRRSELDH